LRCTVLCADFLSLACLKTREYVLGSLTIHFEIAITKYQTDVVFIVICVCDF